MTLASCTGANFFSCNATADTIEPTTLEITSHQNGSALTGPLVVGTNQTLSIWCAAVNTDTPGTLQGLHWRSANNSLVPGVNTEETSSNDVYMVRLTGNSSDIKYTSKWIRVLSFKRVQLSSAGIYKCVANYGGVFKYQGIEIQVSGE